jgi:hypothetical protein
MSITEDELAERDSPEEHEELPVLPGDSPFDFGRKTDRGIDGELPGDVGKDQDPPNHLDD